MGQVPGGFQQPWATALVNTPLTRLPAALRWSGAESERQPDGSSPVASGTDANMALRVAARSGSRLRCPVYSRVLANTVRGVHSSATLRGVPLPVT